MEQDIIKVQKAEDGGRSHSDASANSGLRTPNSEHLNLKAEEGASLSSGSLRLYALPYGCVDLYNYDPLNRRCAVGVMVATEHRRHGYALAMLHELRHLATGNWQLHCLYADIAATNAASIALFAKAGYTQCGLFKEWLKVNDNYIDSIRMQLML